MKRRFISGLLALLLVFGMLPTGILRASAASSYLINGVSVQYDSFSSSPSECWSYANNLYGKIWGQNFTNSFDSSDNMLRDLPDSALTLNAENLKKYVSAAALGSCLRICNSEYLHGTDGWGHSQIIVQKDDNGFTVLEGGLSNAPYCREHYYTWSAYCDSSWPGDYEYIKYIKWPGAEAYQLAPLYGTCGEKLHWSFDASTGTLTITGTGAMTDYCDAPWYPHRNQIKTVVLPTGLTTIGDSAFYECEALTEVTIPNNVTSIGDHSFQYCTNLVSVTVPNGVSTIGVSAFSECANLASVTLPNSVTTLGGGAFTYCTKLTSVNIPNRVTDIAYNSFSYCNLTSIVIPDTVKSIGNYAFDNSGLEMVTFQGDAPKIEYRSFEYVQATVYYPENNDTWTSEVKKNYGGRLTWTSYALQDGWVQKNGKWYLYDKGFALTGWQKDGGKWYYMNSIGEMQTGWQYIDGSWYYLKSSGAMATGWLRLGNIWYYLDPSGAMATGWFALGNIWYYLRSGGDMATGWLKQGGTWYYLKSDGAMATGWLKVCGTWYYFNSSGAMQAGWIKLVNTWYYLKSDGAMATGWVKDGGYWYYFNSSGAMIANTSRKIGGKTYRFNSSGVCLNP